MSIPVIDIGPLLASPITPSPSAEALKLEAAQKIYNAFSTWGFCQITGHNVSVNVQKDLVQNTKDFFALPEEKKLALHVKNGGVAWRGYMPQGGEGTHGSVDQKAGMYFGPEHSNDHPQFGLPLHGKNQFPDINVPGMRPAVLEYIKQVTELGKIICDALSMSLDLDEHFLRDNYLQPEPVTFFRAWRYALGAEVPEGKAWGIGEHSDFGLLTFLKQESAGLQILSPQSEWVDVPVIENAFVCNVGDMLDMISGGRLKSTFHRVIPPPRGQERISFPFFFDFSWTAKMVKLPLAQLSEDEEQEARRRWAKTTFISVNGEWWQYLAKKVQKVFPELNLPDFEHNVSPSTRFAIAVPT